MAAPTVAFRIPLVGFRLNGIRPARVDERCAYVSQGLGLVGGVHLARSDVKASRVLWAARVVTALAAVLVFAGIFALTEQTVEQTSALSSGAQVAVVEATQPEVLEGNEAAPDQGADAGEASGNSDAPAADDAVAREQRAASIAAVPAFPNVSIRQWAHVAEFFAQGLALACCAIAWLLGRHGVAPALRRHPVAVAAMALAASAVCSLFDQTHKLFVPGREFDVCDLGFDALGYVTAISLVFGVWALWKRLGFGKWPSSEEKASSAK